MALFVHFNNIRALYVSKVLTDVLLTFIKTHTTNFPVSNGSLINKITPEAFVWKNTVMQILSQKFISLSVCVCARERKRVSGW